MHESCPGGAIWVRYGGAMRFISLIFFCALAACPPPAPADSGSATTPLAATALAHVSAPIANATVTSPLHVTGVAPADWYFENQFPIQLVDTQGRVLDQAAATPRVNWTENTEPKEFDATLTFTATGPATLVLQEDMPREDAAPRELRVPVALGR
jgi:hypothetical protein